jgi:hypothetical protein
LRCWQFERERRLGKKVFQVDYFHITRSEGDWRASPQTGTASAYRFGKTKTERVASGIPAPPKVAGWGD